MAASLDLLLASGLCSLCQVPHTLVPQQWQQLISKQQLLQQQQLLQ